ncbi:MAG: Fic family protein [Gammaproteobacteria bacterium]|nr:Fic family protein [Gammaproteobacteria bacterium]MDE0453683.1 Fic family protein [Gammaproteobacteria bacterium]
MARRINANELKAIESAVGEQAAGLTAQQVHEALAAPPPRRTLQYRLKYLVDRRRLRREGSGRWARYLPPVQAADDPLDDPAPPQNEIRPTVGPPESAAARQVRRYAAQPLEQRRRAGYHPGFLESYAPNETYYLSPAERAALRDIGGLDDVGESNGGYPADLMAKLLVDLSWNSSRLEGNRYSLLESGLLITRGEAAPGRELAETQMILNHKAAIEFLVAGQGETGMDRSTLLGLHALLADNLLGNSRAAGRLRETAARVAGSTFRPPASRGQIENSFDQILANARAVEDPFEQSFLLLMQLPYCQPFDAANRRVARLAANIPLIGAGLTPLTFENVSRDAYDQAMLGVYELRRRQLLVEVFVDGYRHSASHYAAVRHMLGEPDPFRLKHKKALHELIRGVVRAGMSRKKAATHVRAQIEEKVGPAERTRLRDISERELLSLHSGNCALYRITPGELAEWLEVW